MVLDSATLHDLEILPASTGRGPTLFSLLDRTRTRAGRAHLRRNLLAPAGSPDAIVARQAAHRALADDAVAYRNAIDAAQCEGAERYLSSSWQLSSDRALLSKLLHELWRPEWYRRFL